MSERSGGIDERRGRGDAPGSGEVPAFGKPGSGAAVARDNKPDDSLLAFIEEIYVDERAQDAGWRIEPDADTSRTFIRVTKERAEIPDQGWKLHVSAYVGSAEEVLRRALPVLLEGVSGFKVVSSIMQLGLLNEGRGGLSQVGKFITVYPGDDEEAVRLAVALDEATRGLDGPVVPSDRSLSPGSLVHYRYGAFTGKLVQAPSGQIQPAMAGPDGELVPDRRPLSYQAPEWTEDPFEAAGVVVEPEAPGRVIGRRYLIMDTPHRAPRGSVHQVLDLEEMRGCILKQRRGDSREYLRNEAEVLSRLAPDPRFPEVFGHIEREAEGDLFLAMEEVEGETLAERVFGPARRSLYVPVEQVIGWGRELAAMLGKLHETGFVYRDLKMENVIVAPDGQLRLIDLELACEPGDEDALPGLGTRGYFSPQRAEGAPPAITDDVYSLGALLYGILAHTSPPAAPHPRDLLARPIELMNPAAGPTMIEVVSRCLNADPEARYPSMAALDAALASAGPDASTVPPPFGREPAAESEDEARHRYRELARRLGDTLCEEAREATDGLMWMSKGLDAAGMPLRDLCAGGAGAVLALAELAGELGVEEHRVTLAEGARWLKSSRPISEQPLPGLYVGEAGIAAALLRAGQVLQDGELIDVAAAKGREIYSLPFASPDLFNGAAGRLRFHLLLRDETADPEHLHHAIEAGEFLLEQAQDTANGGVYWRMPEGYGGLSDVVYLGYAHGAAGIADALLDLYEATGEDRFLATAQSVGRWLARQAVPVLDDESGLDWPAEEGQQPFGAAWCHGAVGIGLFFLHAAKLDALPDAADLAARAARTTSRGARSQGPVQCHGLAGNIEFLLDMYVETGDEAYLTEARSLGRLLEAFSEEKDGLLVWPSDSPEVFSPDYMTGYAGVAACLLRLADPEGLPNQLSCSGFRHRRGATPPPE